MRVAGVCTLEAANAYLEEEFLPWWNQPLTAEPAFFQIDRRDVRPGMGKTVERVEQRLDGKIAVRFQGQYVGVRRCAPPLPELPAHTASKPSRCATKPQHKSEWMKNFSLRSGPSLRQASEASHAHH
jgi:hypothetical protein